jgi:hypothetical protein
VHSGICLVMFPVVVPSGAARVAVAGASKAAVVRRILVHHMFAYSDLVSRCEHRLVVVSRPVGRV